jgi:hypothetical protein
MGSTWSFEPWGIGGQCRYAETMSGGSSNPGSASFSNTWKLLYEGVLRANDAITNLPKSSAVSAEKNARLVAECKFLRAYFYLRLNELYGRDGLGVPLYTELMEITTANKGQSSEAEVWAQIIADLTACIDEPNLPDKAVGGRASKGAAYALRGKAYLHQGAKYAEDGTVTKDDAMLNKAVADFGKVKDLGYTLFGNYKAMFTEANEQCDEMIFTIPHVVLTNYGTRAQLYCGSRYATGVSGGGGWGDYQLSPYVVDLYEKADGTPFDWEAVDPDFVGFSSLEPNDRAVFFLRDTLGSDGLIIKQSGDGAAINPTVITRFKTQIALASAGAKAKYLSYGNEARIRQAYTNRDPRLEANVLTPYAGIVGGYDYIQASAASPIEVFYRWPVQAGNSTPATNKRDDVAVDDANNFVYYHRKFVYEGSGLAIRNDGGIDEPLLRYANVLLMWAEALVELNDLAGAQAKVQEVRDRVSIPTIASNFASQATARDYVRDERRREFLNEGVDFFDEMRWRTLKQAKFKNNAGKTETVWGSVAAGGTYTWPATNNLYVWPVPREEIERNPNLTKTPGWTY